MKRIVILSFIFFTLYCSAQTAMPPVLSVYQRLELTAVTLDYQKALVQFLTNQGNQQDNLALRDSLNQKFNTLSEQYCGKQYTATQSTADSTAWICALPNTIGKVHP